MAAIRFALIAFATLIGPSMTAQAQVQQTVSGEQAAAPTINPQTLQTMPRIAAVPNPGLNFAEVQRRCLELFSPAKSAKYSGNVVMSRTDGSGHHHLQYDIRKFTTDGNATGTQLPDGRPTCAVAMETHNSFSKKVRNFHFDGVHLLRYLDGNKGMMFIVQSDNTLYYMNFFTKGDVPEPATIYKAYGPIYK